MALVTAVTSNVTLLNSSNQSILPAWVQNLCSQTTTFASRPEILTLPATATPTAWTITGLAGTSPVTAYIFNTATVVATVLGVAGFTQDILAGDWIKISQFVTTSNITISLASGTGDIVVVLLD